MAALSIDNLKLILHHLVDRNPSGEAVTRRLHQEIEDLDTDPTEIAARVPVPDGFEEVPGAPGTYRKLPT